MNSIRHCRTIPWSGQMIIAVLCVCWILLPSIVSAEERATTETDPPTQLPPRLEMLDLRKVDPYTFTEFIEVNVSLTVHSVSDIDLLNQNFIVDATLDLLWECVNQTVPHILDMLRAVLPPSKIDADGKVTESFSIPINEFRRFWIPDPFFVDASLVVMPSLDTPTQNLYWSYKKPLPRIGFRTRQRIRVRCELDFRMYPLDFQICKLRIRSATYTASQMKFKWNQELKKTPGPVYEGPETLMGSTIDIKQCEYKEDNLIDLYSGVCVEFKHTRLFAYIFLSTVMPVFLLVTASFCPSFMSIHSTADRVSVSVVLLQAMLSLFAQVRSTVPPIPYVTCMDILIITSTMTISATLLQSIIVQVLLVRQDRNNIRSLNENRRRHEERLDKDFLLFHLIGNHKRSSGPEASRTLRKFQSYIDSLESTDRRLRSGLINSIKNFANVAVPLSPVKFNYYAGRCVVGAYLVFQILYWSIVTYSVSRKSARHEELAESDRIHDPKT